MVDHRRREQEVDIHAELMADESRKNCIINGVCPHCQRNLINPYLPAQLCLECWENMDGIGCMAKGCTNSVDGRYQQAALCKVHLADTVHKEHEKYMSLKSELHEKQQELEDIIGDADIEVPKDNQQWKDLSEEEKKARDLKTEIMVDERELNTIKSDIQEALKDVPDLFPDGFTVFG